MTLCSVHLTLCFVLRHHVLKDSFLAIAKKSIRILYIEPTVLFSNEVDSWCFFQTVCKCSKSFKQEARSTLQEKYDSSHVVWSEDFCPKFEEYVKKLNFNLLVRWLKKQVLWIALELGPIFSCEITLLRRKDPKRVQCFFESFTKFCMVSWTRQKTFTILSNTLCQCCIFKMLFYLCSLCWQAWGIMKFLFSSV